MFNLAVLYQEKGNLEAAEKYYLLAIDRGDTGALNNLAELLYSQNKEAPRALKYVLDLKKLKTPTIKELLFEKIISVWAGKPEVLDDIEVLIQQTIEENKKDSEDADSLEIFITDLLIHHQKNTVWQWFQNPNFGGTLQDMLKPLYFATARLLNNTVGKEVLLTQPPELNETVEDVYQYILKRQAFYYGKEDKTKLA